MEARSHPRRKPLGNFSEPIQEIQKIFKDSWEFCKKFGEVRFFSSNVMAFQKFINLDEVVVSF